MIEVTQDAAGVDVVTLARPPVNALDLDAIFLLESTFRTFANTPPARGLVLTGKGAMFSAGVDVRAFTGYDSATRRTMVLEITRMTAALLAIPSPVVAAINGHALGGGFVLALCCDYRLVVDAPAVKLGIPEAQAGVPFPVGPTHIIQHEVPAPLLRRLALASAIMSPRALTEAGVFDQAATADALVADASAAVVRLAAQPAFATVKRQVRGALADTVAALAAAGTDPYLDSFG